MSLIAATVFVAIATTVLAVGAIVTAVFAFLAFGKQSQEVGILQQQMHEHQQALEHEVAERHREQASRVWVLMAPDDDITKRDFPAKRLGREETADEAVNGPALEAMVTNASEQQQPIYDARLYWYRSSGLYGTPNPEVLGAVPGYERTARSRNFPPATDLAACGAFLTFRDAAGFAWMRAPDGTLTEHAPGELHDAALAAVRTLADPTFKARPQSP
jgi:hypothetical protein